MNKIQLTAISFFFALFCLMSQAQAQLLPTNMMVTVLDDKGNVQVGASVKVYASEEDFEEDQNPVATGVTDAKGRVTFKKLEEKSYYIRAKKGEKANDDGSYQTGALAASKINKVNIIINTVAVPKIK